MSPIEVRFRAGPAKVWLIVLAGLMIPFMVACTGLMVWIWVWAALQNPGLGKLAGLCALMVPTVVVMLWAVLVFVRMAVCVRKYVVRSGVALRADEAGVHARELIRGRFRSLAWDEVGAIGTMPMGGLYVEPEDPEAWMRTQPWRRRLSMRSFRRKHGYVPAVSCGLPVEGVLAELVEELTRIRDLRRGESPSGDRRCG